MEIKLSQNLSAVSRLASGPARTPETKVAVDTGEFARAEALNQTLAATPDARPEVVASTRARAVDVNYPPREVIERIANLLALNLKSTVVE